jgi:hypothetical protein
MSTYQGSGTSTLGAQVDAAPGKALAASAIGYAMDGFGSSSASCCG